MDEHDKLAEDVERDVAALEHDGEQVGEHADDARDKLDAANSEAGIPAALGRQDPAYRTPQPDDDRSADDALLQAEEATSGTDDESG